MALFESSSKVATASTGFLFPVVLNSLKTAPIFHFSAFLLYDEKFFEVKRWRGEKRNYAFRKLKCFFYETLTCCKLSQLLVALAQLEHILPPFLSVPASRKKGNEALILFLLWWFGSGDYELKTINSIRCAGVADLLHIYHFIIFSSS